MQELSSDLIVEVGERIRNLESPAALEELKAAYLGPNGIIRGAMKSMGQMPAADRPEYGKKINCIKNAVEELLINKIQELNDQTLRKKFGNSPDISLNICDQFRGNIHPLTKMRERLECIFNEIGFVTVDGPEIETEWYCFDALNTPESHPAREVMDTFFVPNNIKIATTEKHGTERYLLRSHTSTVQIRTMTKETPPIRIVSPGRAFRRDVVDATHSANFHQLEFLYIDTKVTVCDLKSTIDYVLKALFGKGTETRLRPSFFPFTEPSFEVDFRSSSLGKLSNKWVEILGCGMIDPNVLSSVGIDSERYRGFAAAFGIERLAMLFHGIDDIRLFYQNDLRFLDQF